MISVIVVDYNGGKVTEECINSIRASTYTDYELIVVDNYATKQFYAEGLNEGIKKAKGDILVCCSNDIVVHTDWLTHIVEGMRDKGIGIANPLVLDIGEGYPFAAVSKLGFLGYPYSSIEYYFDTIYYGNIVNRIRHVRIKGKPDYANGCCMVIRREAIDRVGMFDEKFHIFYDDVDMSLRIRKAGYKVAVIEKAIVWHKGGDTINKRSYFINKRRHIHDLVRFMYKKMKGVY